jgi:hypothetical protein
MRRRRHEAKPIYSLVPSTGLLAATRDAEHSADARKSCCHGLLRDRTIGALVALPAIPGLGLISMIAMRWPQRIGDLPVGEGS